MLQTADCSAGSHTAHRAGRYPKNRHAGRAEHDPAMPDHSQSRWRKCPGERRQVDFDRKAAIVTYDADKAQPEALTKPRRTQPIRPPCRSDATMSTVIPSNPVLTCPHCGHAQRKPCPRTKPVLLRYPAAMLLRPKPGDCCVFCSFGSGAIARRADLGTAAPEVIAGQVDVLPAERRQVLQQAVIDGWPWPTQGVRGPLQIDRVPQHDGRRHQVGAAGR